jgi:hypothetical protein
MNDSSAYHDRIAPQLTEYALALQSLADDDAHVFARAVVALDEAELDRLCKAIASAHAIGTYNVTSILERWLTQHPDAALELMNAVEHIRDLNVVDARRYLDFAARVPEGYQYLAAIKLVRAFQTTPTLTGMLFDALTESDPPLEVLNAWAIAAGNGTRVVAVALALAGSGSNADALLCLVLQSVDLSLPEVIAELSPRESDVVQRLGETALAFQPPLSPWWVLARLSLLYERAGAAVVAAVLNGEVRAVVGLANSLAGQPLPAFGRGEYPMRATIALLVDAAMRSESVQPGVDNALAILSRRTETHEDVMQAWEELGRSHDPVESIFKKTFDAIGRHRLSMARLLSAWLIDDKASNSRIRALISAHEIGRPVVLDIGRLASAVAERRIKVARRLLALTYDGPTLCGFIQIFAEEALLQPAGVGTAGEMLNYALDEFPSAAHAFLKEKAHAAPKGSHFRAMYRSLYCNALIWHRELDRLPVAGELQAESRQAQALWAMQNRHNRDILRGARAQSIFASMSTNLHIAQGQRVVSHQGMQTSAILDLQAHSQAMELPNSEIADPVGGVLRRRQLLRNAK